ncbi:DUF3168 domain-containing protein [Rhizobium sp. KVB221]|uniref:DUF3168 domain-containing protein n=1 Tax=Rhizobium setariae TaxID=2801340 RepID=A0A936YK55_9HYPH|nr:DUF3168 domain-containing protein [Rhizobium setariae]MBL0371073.1 DUF3168 domain-containing protein [Rhizobium setariae]
MADTQNALQKAVFAVLAADAELLAIVGADGISDRRMTGRSMPYLVIAELESRDFGPQTEEHFLTIEAWPTADGRRQVQTMAGRVRALLHDAAPLLDGAMLINLRHVSTRVRREARTKAFVAEMRFRAVTE